MRIYRHLDHKLKPCVLTIGNYDGIHIGHQVLINELVNEAKKFQIDSALLTFEPHPREFFNRKNAPVRIISLREKLEFFKKKGISRVYVIRFNKKFSEITADQFLALLRDNINAKKIIVGKDFRFGKNRAASIEDLREALIEVIEIKAIEHNQIRVSSTMIRESLDAADFQTAAALLGRPYEISGVVRHGRKIGREIGFPTANIHMFHKRPALKGVFAVKLGGLYGVANLGLRPTFLNDSLLSLEVHLFNFDQNIYGKHVRVEFVEKLRDEAKFNSVEDLKQQIQEDIKKAKEIFNI
jgi:riboflavin kinase/FMN adenylyltransferase